VDRKIRVSNYSDSLFDESSSNTSWYKVFNLIGPGSRVLDVGCSSGNFGKELISRKRCTVDGIEIDEGDAKIASTVLNRVWRLDIETADLSDLPTGAYDIVYFGDVIEHLVNPVATLRRIKRLLSTKGRVIFSIPNMGHVSVRLALLAGRFEYTETGLLDKTHLHFYTQDEVDRIFEEAGYRIKTLDFVRKDYPRSLLEKELAKYGLKANNNFYKKMASTQASAFQFVGSAKPGAQKNRKLKQFGPIDMFETYYNDTKNGYESKIAELQSVIASQKKQIRDLQSVIKSKGEHPYRAVGEHIKKRLMGGKSGNKSV